MAKIEMISKDEWEESIEKRPLKRKKHRNIKVILIFLIFFIGISGVIFVNYNNIVTELSKVKAIKYSEKEIESRLASPSTAKFPNFLFNSEDCNVKLVNEDDDGYTWAIASYVDSQNYMGAMIRKTWGIGIKISKDGKQYQILDIETQ